jgi:HSP20 family protein
MPIQTATGNPYHSSSNPSGKAMEAEKKGSFKYLPNESWRPNVNLYENDASYLVCVDLGGVDKREIDVLVEDQTLRIRGTRQVPMPEDYPEQQKPRIRIHLMEIDNGTFSRDVELPANVKKDHIVATHRNGMLWIELPKKP